MIVMYLKADNLCGFRNFDISFTYPRKPAHSTIEETLKGFPRFRYKKMNIIMGSNASGKTTLGRVMSAAFNFINRQNTAGLKSLIGNADHKAFLEMDFIPDGKTLYHLSVKIIPSAKKTRQSAGVSASLLKESINKTDTYESCLKRLKKQTETFTTDYMNLFENVSWFGWLFTFPGDNPDDANEISKTSTLYPEILRKVMMTLDNSIEDVTKVPGVSAEDYLLKISGQKDRILIHNGEISPADITRVSSGTREGVRIASFISAVKEGRIKFYYSDEMFSYIQTDIERAVLAVLSVSMGENDQLFVTSHNSEILDLDLPLHSFIFMRKDHALSDCPISAVDAGRYIKKNNVSLKNAAENDLFFSMPELSRIFEIEEL
jgi:AAA15 family ATPase/GTPase